jgi:molybdopterin-biosynthesis enzyme MoeA-like protein
VTAGAVAAAFGVELVLDEEAARRIGRGSRDLTPARLKMAIIPQGATLIDNPISQAPGFRIGNVFVMAGIPGIARAMFAGIERELENGDPILSESVDVYQRESDIAAPLEAIALTFPAVEIGSYPFQREGRFGATLVVRGTDRATVDAALAAIKAALGVD